MSQFFSEENLRLLVNISKKYMQDKYNFTENDKIHKKLIYNIMSDIDEEFKGKNIPLENKNINVLNTAKDFYITKYKLQVINKPNIQSLSRDKEIFGNRPMNTQTIVPDINTYQKKHEQEDNTPINRIMEQRDSELGINNKPDINKLAPSTKDTPEDNELFMKRLKDFETQRNIDERNQIDKETHDMLQIDKHDPKTIFINFPNQQQPPLDEPLQGSKALTINPKTTQSRLIDKYISINSQDRVWWNSESILRYQYYVNINTRIRNIDSINVGKVIVPDEIIQFIDPVKPSFNYNYNFSYPYLVLRIEEFNDIYEGTNDVIRKGFCKLVFHKAYKGQNGRGYVILKPEQKERKYFYPAPLSSLNKLTISLLKPSGQLFNNSTDNHKILNIETDPNKPEYLKITSNMYFDKNEFSVSDCVLFKNYNMTKLSISQFDVDIKIFNSFINRTEGHDILELGDVNASGYFNIFYIKTVGEFNPIIGEFTPSTQTINCLNNYNNYAPPNTVNGCMMNLSLQHSISMKLDIIVDDAKILDTQTMFNF